MNNEKNYNNAKNLGCEVWFCPQCKKFVSIKSSPALSRKDNKTQICSDCGTREAMEDYFKR